MRIVYMGTPEFAVPPFKTLCARGRTPVLAVTRPDRRRDRGKKLLSPPVKDVAAEYGVPVAQPESLRDDGFWEELANASPDLIIVVAYGMILPRDALELPRLGCVNVHASILPAYRGAAPIQRAVMNGERETGVTLMRMSEVMDAGDVIAVRRTEVGDKTAGGLADELSLMGADLLADLLPDIEEGRAPRRPQDEAEASYAPMIRKEEAHVDFSRDPREVCALIRAMNPKPTAFARMGDETMKLWEAVPAPAEPSPAGTVISASEEGVLVAADGGGVLITTLQAPGKRPMRAGEYLRGNDMCVGAVFT